MDSPDPLRRNLATLAARSPEAAQQVRLAASASAWPGWRIEPTRSGSPTLSTLRDGAVYRLHRTGDPAAEDLAWLDRHPLADLSCGYLVVYGLGLGYHLKGLIQKLNPQVVVIVLETDLTLASAAMAAVDLAELLSHPRIEFALAPALDDALRQMRHKMDGLRIAHLGAGLLAYPPEAALRPDEPAAIGRFLDDLAEEQLLQRATHAKLSAQGARHTLANLTSIISSPSPGLLRGRFAGHAALIASAGPSLSRDFDLVAGAAGRAVVLAVDTAYKVFFGKGAAPDFVVAMDPGERNFRHFAGCPQPGTLDERRRGPYLVAEPRVTPQAINLFEGRRFIGGLENSPAGNSVLRWIFSLTEQRYSLHARGSTSLTAFHLAVAMGCNPIILIGQDLAYTGGKAYADGTAKTDQELKARGGRVVAATTGDQVATDTVLYVIKRYLEEDLREKPAGLRVINCSLGGARIEGTEEMPLAQALAQLAGPVEVAPVCARLCEQYRPLDVSRLLADAPHRIETLHRLKPLARDGAKAMQALLDSDIPSLTWARQATAPFRQVLGADRAALDLLKPFVAEAAAGYLEQGAAFATAVDSPENGRLEVQRHLELFRAMPQAIDEVTRLLGDAIAQARDWAQEAEGQRGKGPEGQSQSGSARLLPSP